MGLGFWCLRGCEDFILSLKSCEIFSPVERGKVPARLVNEVGGQEQNSQKGEVEEEVPKHI